MSLTSLLHGDSPLKRWFHAHLSLPVVCQTLDSHNFTMKKEPIIIRPDGKINFPLCGSAFAYGLRWWVSPDLDRWVRHTTAWKGLGQAGLRRQFLAHFKGFSPLGAVLLAEYEGMGRSGKVTQLLDKNMNYIPHDKVYENTINDVGALCQTIGEVFTNQDVAGAFHPNPTFAGSYYVGGADAQLVSGTTIYDVRTTLKGKPATLNNFYQQIAYLLLDFDDTYRIDTLAWYYSRQRALFVYPVAEIVPDVSGLRRQLLSFLQKRQAHRPVQKALQHISFA